MDELNLDFSQVECDPVDGFHFTLPEEMTGRDDIDIYIEYAIDEIGYASIDYTVWAQMCESETRKQIFESSVPGKAGRKTAIRKILRDLSKRDDFVDAIMDFVYGADT